ncbi:EamA/RhaT family transporter [Streptomyces sp. NPDC006458]|uniref:EamA/RhaT family transporter n=1 Tax=Streptomyces sp. NPDC006458 TaxID=3154302 RepID=UPI0033B6830C
MSDKQNGNGTRDQAEDSHTGGPTPEPLRLFGTTWVNHDNGYGPRRVGAAVGSLALAAVACLVLRFAYEGLEIADIGSFVTVLVIVMFAASSALAFGHTWESYRKRPDPDRQASLRGLLAIGFVGSLLAYFFRSLTEAPGEKLHRQEYEAALEQHQKRSTRRTGNPSKRRRRS